LTFPVAKVFASELSTYFPIFIIEPETLYMDIVAGLIVALMAGIFPAWRAIKISIADGLRRIG